LDVESLRARFAGAIGRDKVIELMSAGHIPSIRIGKKLVAHVDDVEAFEELIRETTQPLEFTSRAGEVILSVIPTSPQTRRKEAAMKTN
jgi:hypothetical protein